MTSINFTSRSAESKRISVTGGILMIVSLLFLSGPLPAQPARNGPGFWSRGMYVRTSLDSSEAFRFPFPANVHPLSAPAFAGDRQPSPSGRVLSVLSDTALFQPVPGPYGGTVRSIAVDSGGQLYVATDGGVYRSTDNGAHWNGGSFPTWSYSYIEPVTVLGPNVIVAETDYISFISTDRGESWNTLSLDVRGFAVDTNGVIYAGSRSGGLKRSVDTAKSWQTFALAGKQIWDVVLCGDGRIICPFDTGVYSSTDNGATWTLTPRSTTYGIWSLTSDRRGHLFAVNGPSVIRSDDFGVTWQSTNVPLDRWESIYRLYADRSGGLLVVTDGRIFATSDAGSSWSSLGAPPGRPLTVGRDARGAIAAGNFDGYFRLNESSGQWEESNQGMRARDIFAIAVTATGSILVYTPYKWLRSADDGASWGEIAFDSTVYPFQTAYVTSSGSIFIAASFRNSSALGLLRSTDDGVTWEPISIPSNYYAINGITEGTSGNLLIATSYGDLYLSTDGGDTWVKVLASSTGSMIRAITADKAGNYFAAIDSAILVSHGGTVWSKVPLPRYPAYSEWMNVDAYGQIYLASGYSGVYTSIDTGKTWRLMVEGLYNSYVMSTAADRKGNVIVGTARGIYRLADQVDGWELYSAGFPSTYVNALAVSPAGYLFGGTQSYGMYRSVSPLPPRSRPEFREFLSYILRPNYPNPFNSGTIIPFDLPLAAKVELKIYNMLGQEVATIASGEFQRGKFGIHWAPQGIPSGVYFCEMTAQSYFWNFRQTIRLLYLK